MKKLIVAAAFIATLSAPAQSEVGEFCTGIYELSKQVMTSRQGGVSLIRMLEVVERLKGTELDKSIVMDAFEYDVYATEKYKQQTINDFSNSYLLACLKGEAKNNEKD